LLGGGPTRESRSWLPNANASFFVFGVSACSSSQQQSSRSQGDEQVNLALLDAELGPDVSRTYQQSTGRDMVNKTLVGPCCQP